MHSNGMPLLLLVIACSMCCCANSEDICNLPADPGRCRALIPAFYYDPTSKECEEFFYGGCGGNANRFSSKEECEKACVTKSASDVIPSVISASIL